MQKYQKPIARNLGDLQPVLGVCNSGSAADPNNPECISGAFPSYGGGGYCLPGSGAIGDTCVSGGIPNDGCETGSSAAYPA